MEIPKKILIFPEMEFWKKLLRLQEMKLSHISRNGNPKKLLNFRK